MAGRHLLPCSTVTALAVLLLACDTDDTAETPIAPHFAEGGTLELVQEVRALTAGRGIGPRWCGWARRSRSTRS